MNPFKDSRTQLVQRYIFLSPILLDNSLLNNYLLILQIFYIHFFSLKNNFHFFFTADSQRNRGSAYSLHCCTWSVARVRSSCGRFCRAWIIGVLERRRKLVGPRTTFVLNGETIEISTVSFATAES